MFAQVPILNATGTTDLPKLLEKQRQVSLQAWGQTTRWILLRHLK